ncbi:MAG: hypothetical protein KJ799_02375 [Bacteroidetes bacterium]|nr:hypothetical protein [Bacteroidota bacterium]MBU2505557.1 hypothetical protein [Bacteroidota bacterium]
MKNLLLLLYLISVSLTEQQTGIEKIIFASDRDSALYPNLSLYVMDTDGSNANQLVDSLIGYMPRVSKDGKSIAYI